MSWFGAALGVFGVVLLGFLGSTVGAGWAKGELLSYNEYWNGYETAAIWEVDGCEYNGSCRHTYDCDPYEVAVTHTTTDSKGNTSTYVTYETHYNSCPYATEEWTFKIATSLKTEYTIVDRGFATDPVAYRAYERGIPDDVFRGIPQFWAEAKARIDSGNPGPVTEKRSYDNYILASQSTILKEYSGAVAEYEASKQIPKIATATDKAGIKDNMLKNYQGYGEGDYAIAAKQAGLKIITWSLDRSGPLKNGGDGYYATIKAAIDNDGDEYTLIDVLARQVGVIGMFSDWPATVTYYANCFGL